MNKAVKSILIFRGSQLLILHLAAYWDSLATRTLFRIRTSMYTQILKICNLYSEKRGNMLRATMTSPGEIEFSDVPQPIPRAGEVLLRIRRIGICGSDIHVFHGKHPYTSYPVVQGHEFSAEVVRSGSPASSLKPGALVTATPQITCGECAPCGSGKYHICEHLKVIGFKDPGVAQEYFVIPESTVLQLPEQFSPELGALVEPTAVAVHALRRAGDIAGKGVLVLGAGPIGNLVAQVARWRGASQTIITDLSDHRLELAHQCEIAECINTRGDSLDAHVQRVFGDGRADVILECVGAAETANQAIRCARKGSTIVVVGVFGDRPQIDLGLVQDHELQLLGSLMYRREDYEDAILCLAQGGVVSGPLLTGSFPFRRYLNAYRFIEANRERVMKVMIDLDHLDA